MKIITSAVALIIQNKLAADKTLQTTIKLTLAHDGSKSKKNFAWSILYAFAYLISVFDS